MNNKPTHIVYHVKDVDGDNGESRGYWTKVGAAWANKDAKGMSLVLDLLPLNGRLVIRTAVPREDTAADAEAEADTNTW